MTEDNQKKVFYNHTTSFFGVLTAVITLIVSLVLAASALATVPTNTVLPVVSGSTNQGQILATTNGSWSGSPTPTYTYQWQDCNISGLSCSNISGATASTYTLQSTDVGHTIDAVVTATNTSGATSATSAYTAIIVPPACQSTNLAGNGDGSDGAVTLTGNIVLSRDMCYTTLNSAGYSINTNGWRILATTSITVTSGSVISDNGTAASANTGGAGEWCGVPRDGLGRRP